MKYKFIKDGKEYPSVEDDGYIYVYNNDELRERSGEWFINLPDGKFYELSKDAIGWEYEEDNHKKIISTNNPLLISVPQFTLEDNIGKMADDYLIRYFGNAGRSLEQQQVYAGFVSGYAKAKSQYQYTEEDMIAFADFILGIDAEERFSAFIKHRVKTIQL